LDPHFSLTFVPPHVFSRPIPSRRDKNPSCISYNFLILSFSLYDLFSPDTSVRTPPPHLSLLPEVPYYLVFSDFLSLTSSSYPSSRFLSLLKSIEWPSHCSFPDRSFVFPSSSNQEPIEFRPSQPFFFIIFRTAL